MLRRTLLVSGLILASTVGFANSAKAAELVMPFGGEIEGGCTIIKGVDGALIKNGAGDGLTSTGGTAGTFTVNCDAAATVSVEKPVQGEQDLEASPVLNPTLTVAAKSDATVEITDLGQAKASESSTITIENDQLNKNLSGTINMDANVDAGALAAGEYTYTVKVTANPD